MTPEIAALNLFVALVCGALIGSERQVRRRMAGLRTNALVALGAAGFVVFSTLYPDEVSPTRVAAQVVSGIGFLGAGIIFRHGLNVHGLNTAATLWCSAAVGITAGAGWLVHAALLTGLIVFVNLGLRPLVAWIKNRTGAGMAPTREYRLTLSATEKDSDAVRALVSRQFSAPGFRLMAFEADAAGADAAVELRAELSVEARDDELFKAAMMPLMQDLRVRGLSWEPLSED